MTDREDLSSQVDEVLRALHRADAGVVSLERLTDRSCSNNEYLTGDGWRFWVFDDVLEWDYVAAFAAPDDKDETDLWSFLHQEGPYLEWVYSEEEDRGPEPEPDQWEPVRAWKPANRNLWRWGY